MSHVMHIQSFLQHTQRLFNELSVQVPELQAPLPGTTSSIASLQQSVEVAAWDRGRQGPLGPL